MRLSWRRVLAFLCYAAGSLGWCYVGAYMSLTKPVWGVFRAIESGSFHLFMLLTAAVQVFVYLSIAGGVWCIGYMLSDYFKDKDKNRENEMV